MEKGLFEYGVYFSSLEYNIANKNTNMSKTSIYYLNKVKDILRSFIEIYNNIENSSVTTTQSFNLQNAGLIQDLRTVMLFDNNDIHSKVGSEQIKRTLKLLSKIEESLDEYVCDYKHFFNRIEKNEYELLLNFAHFMSNVYEKQSINLETSYSNEPEFHTNAIL